MDFSSSLVCFFTTNDIEYKQNHNNNSHNQYKSGKQ